MVGAQNRVSVGAGLAGGLERGSRGGLSVGVGERPNRSDSACCGVGSSTRWNLLHPGAVVRFLRVSESVAVEEEISVNRT